MCGPRGQSSRSGQFTAGGGGEVGEGAHDGGPLSFAEMGIGIGREIGVSIMILMVNGLCG